MAFLKKLFLALKEYGIRYVFRAGVEMIRNKFYVYFVANRKRNEYIKQLKSIVVSEKIFLWTQDFGWSVPLFQRPQHIARCLARNGVTVFYYTNNYYDPDVASMKMIEPNLYLVNRHNTVFLEQLNQYLDNTTKTKYYHVYSTNLETTLEQLKDYEAKGYHILYEYIDDLAPEISGTKEVPKNIQEKFDYVTSDDHIPMTVTADLLRNQIVEARGEKNLAFSTNGVDVDHFRVIKKDFAYNDKFAKVLARKKKIVGYYGAVAKWFDYDLMKYVAKALPDVDFVLIGKLYDESYTNSGIESVPNIHFIGPVPYDDIPQYASKFNICTIPFLVNSITNATSPLKLFEYMAMGKPVLTTAMLESSKYASVHTSRDYEEYVAKVKELLTYSPETQPAYYDLLRKEAEENRWERKTEIILEMLAEYEGQFK